MGLWFLLAHWQIARAVIDGVIFDPFRPKRSEGGPWRGTDIAWVDSPIHFSLALGAWTFAGPVFLVGILAFLWIQRNDRY